MKSTALFSFVIASILLPFTPRAFATARPTKAQPRVLTLKAAAEKALRLNPQLGEKEEHINQMEAQIPITRSQLLPNIKLTATESRAKGALLYPLSLFNGNPYNQYETTLSLTQPLFAIGSISAIHAARLDRNISQLDAQIDRRNLLSQLIQAYFQVVMTTRNKQILQQQFKILKESFQTAVHRARIGRSQLLDALQTKTQLALLDSQIANATSQYEVAVAQLANVIGEPKLTNFEMKNSLKVPSLKSVDQMIQPSLKNHTYQLPELRENTLNAEKVADQKEEMLGENLPSLEFVGSYGELSYKKSDLFTGPAQEWNIGLQLNVPLFSGLSTLYQLRSYASQERQLDIDRQNIENQMTLQQVSARKTLQSAARSILSGEAALKLARASSDEARRDYRYATIDVLQFLQVQTSYMQAESALNTYKYNYLVALANYYVANGQPMMNLINLLEEINK